MEDKQIKRPSMKLLSDDLLERIVEEAKDVLEETGVLVYNEEGLKILGEGGARINPAELKAYIPRNLVEAALKSVPHFIQIYDRKGSLAVNLEGDNCNFCSAGDAITIWDSTLSKLRQPTVADQIKFYRLVDCLDSIDAQGATLLFTDVPAEIRGCSQVFLCLSYALKPMFSDSMNEEEFQVINDFLVTIRGSEKALRDKPIVWWGCCPSPPLKWSEFICHALIRCAEHSIPALIVPMPVCGTNAPVTMAGSLVQHTAEALSGVVINQMTKPGAPVIWGGSPVVFDMRFNTVAMGAIESAMMGVACTEIGKYLGFPTRSYIGCADAKCPDAQAGAETTIGTILSVLAGNNLIINAGMLNSESAQSLEKLVIDNEINKMARHLAKGIIPRRDRLAEELFGAGLYEGTHFLASQLTLRWCREEFCYPGPVISRENQQMWVEEGATTAAQRAKFEVDRLLATSEPELLKEDIYKELVNIMKAHARRHGVTELPFADPVGYYGT